MHPTFNIAIRAVRKAGNFIAKYYETPDAVKVIQTRTNNFITNVNCEAERFIIKVIRKYYPQHTIISQESGELTGEDNDVQWIIDPLDGTINFIKQLPHFAVSIAVRIRGRTEVAVVYDPMRNELFTALHGQGVQLNGYRLRGGAARDLHAAILAIGFPIKQKEHPENYFALVSELFIHCADFRRIGSTALDFAYLAAGRVDGLLEIGLNPWNFTVGELLVRESGLLITDFTGGHIHLLSENIIAGNPRIVKAMLLILRGELCESMIC